MKKIILMSFALAGLYVAKAQSNLQVSGTVYDNGKHVIESANVNLLLTADTTKSKQAITTKEGAFSFVNLDKGKYFVKVKLIGYADYVSEPIVLDANNSPFVIKSIVLKSVSKDLAAVTVESKKPLIEQKPDRTIVNVDASPSNTGASALDVLEKSPGVTVDKDGNVSLKGKAGVQIYIDGRPAYLSGTDLANYLRNMQSSQLDQIEIMTNPPAKYDAAGNAGIINIKTKKNKIFGLNGSFTTGYSQGIYAGNNDNFNINYRKNKINLFGNVTYNHNKRAQELYIDRKFMDSATKNITSLFSQRNSMVNINDYYAVKAGMDYTIDKKNTIGFVLSNSINPGDFNSNGAINISNPTNVLQSETAAKSLSHQQWNNYSTNVNFRHQFDSAGKELTGDFDYINYASSNHQQVSNQYYNPNGTVLMPADTLLGNLPQNITIYSMKLDYAMPLKGGAKFEAGIKSSYVTTDANALYDSLKNGVYVHDYNRSNHFIYKENIHAAYINFNKPFSKKINMQLGLRAEQTVAHGNQVTTNISFDKNYIQLFPTMYLQYSANDKNDFVLNYGRRIRRPDYQSLNPFIEFLDRYTFQQGNPYLQPQFSHNIELTHTYRGFLTTTLNYTNTTDIIQEVLEQNSATNQSYIKEANIAKQQQYGISINAYNKYTKWWSGNIYMNVYNNQFQGIVNNAYVSIGSTTAMFNVSQQFKFNKGWGADVSGFYMTKSIEGVFTIQPFGMMNLGISKQLFKNKATVKLAVRDVLHTQTIYGTSKYSTIDAAFHQYNDNRVVSVSFTYRFNKGKLNANVPKRKTGGADDESSRIKTGN